MGLAERAAAVVWLLLALLYIVPYTVLRDAGGWVLYEYWAALGTAAVVVAWIGVRGWERGE